MTLEHGAPVDDDVLAGTAALASVGILSALDADAVVAGIEDRVDDEGVAARLQVECVAILRVGRVACQHIVDDDVLAHQRMDVPCRRVLEDDVLEQHVLAAHETDHDGT